MELDLILYSFYLFHQLTKHIRLFCFSYECLCVTGVTGANCQININECDSNPCQFGTCTDKIGGYVCECEDGYEGVHCEQVT